MTIEALLTQAVTVVRWSTTTDRYNNVVRDEPTRTVHYGRLEQTDTTEVTEDRATVISDWRLFLPAGATIGAHDQIETDDATFEVVGEPDPVWGHSGVHHLECRLRHVS